MADIYECADAFKNLLDIEYELILGKKSKNATLNIIFEKSHFFHLLGLQHLKDIAMLLSGERDKFFDKVLSRRIDSKIIENSNFYPEIKSRIDFLPKLEQLFDSNDTIFKYNPKLEQFSLIQADFLMKNFIEQQRIFTFLSKSKDDKYFCRSFFPDNEKDYSANQVSWTLLFKKKIFKSTRNEIELYRHKNFKALS